jgi:hypothetical protein
MLNDVCLEVNPVGKPDAVAPHVRFDERGRETGLQCYRARPRLYYRPIKNPDEPKLMDIFFCGKIYETQRSCSIRTEKHNSELSDAVSGFRG